MKTILTINIFIFTVILFAVVLFFSTSTVIAQQTTENNSQIIEKLRLRLDSLETQLNEINANQQSDSINLKYDELKLRQLDIFKVIPQDVLTRRLIENLEFGGFVIASDSTRINVGGLIIGNAFQDFREMNSENYFAISEIPINSGNRFRTRFDVSNSRFYINSIVKTTSAMNYKTRFEFDLFNASGAYGFNLRHAFAQFGRFGIGYTYSNFMNVDISPNGIDLGGASGEVGRKQTQVQYIRPLSEKMRFAISLEDGQGNLLLNDGIIGSTRAGPDLVSNFRYRIQNSSTAHIQLAAVIHPVNYKPVSHSVKGDFGWGVNLCGSFDVGKSKDHLSWQFAYTKGASKYINDPIAAYDAIVNLELNKIDLIELYNGYIYYHHRWSNSFASNVGYSFVTGNKNQYSSEEQTKIGHYASANLIYYPNNKVAFGIESIWGTRKCIGGKSTFNSRLQLQAMFAF